LEIEGTEVHLDQQDPKALQDLRATLDRLELEGTEGKLAWKACQVMLVGQENRVCQDNVAIMDLQDTQEHKEFLVFLVSQDFLD
jgi:3-dehydroquinate synthase class II